MTKDVLLTMVVAAFASSWQVGWLPRPALLQVCLLDFAVVVVVVEVVFVTVVKAASRHVWPWQLMLMVVQ
jgi:hypothetical protein